MTGADLLAWQGVVIFVVVLIAGAVFLVVFLRHRREVTVAQAALTRDDAYRLLAEQTSAEVARLAGEVADLRRSMSEVERLMRAVD
jgi:hypothetical protein